MKERKRNKERKREREREKFMYIDILMSDTKTLYDAHTDEDHTNRYKNIVLV